MHQLGFDEVQKVQVGKVVEIELAEEGEAALQRIRQMCEKLLVNDAVETYKICQTEALP